LEINHEETKNSKKEKNESYSIFRLNEENDQPQRGPQERRV